MHGCMDACSYMKIQETSTYGIPIEISGGAIEMEDISDGSSFYVWQCAQNACTSILNFKAAIKDQMKGKNLKKSKSPGNDL